MRGVLLAFEPPSSWWATRLATRVPALRLQFLNVVPRGGGQCVITLQMTGPPVDEAMAWLDDKGLLHTARVMHRQDDGAVVRLHRESSFLARVIEATGAVPEFPFVVEHGEVHWLVLEDTASVRRLMSWCDAEGLRYRTVRSGAWETATDRLTDHQMTVFQRAMKEGYYETPRRITLTELARRADVSKSTLSQTLATVEQKIMAAHRTHHAAALQVVPAKEQNGRSPGPRS